MNAERMLVVGAAGFIGRKVVARAAAEGFDVVGLDLAARPAGIPSGVHWFQGDAASVDVVRAAASGCSSLIYLAYDAGTAGPSASSASGAMMAAARACQCLEECGANGIRRMVLVSSGGTVYGKVQGRAPIVEGCELRPVSPYGLSKAVLEQVGTMVGRQFGCEVIVARPSNAYGPGQRPFSGQGLIATAFGCALLGRRLTLFGGGSAIRDYIHVEDLARGLLAIVRSGSAGATYNLGSGSGLSTARLVDSHIRPIVESAGLHLLVALGPARDIDVDWNVLDCTRAADDVGFRCEVDLSSGLADVFACLSRELFHA